MAKEEPTTRQTYDAGSSVGLGVAVYFALSTALRIERDKQGKWSFKMKLKPASHELLRS